MYLFIFIAGFGGGALRGLVGFIKHQFSYKNVEFKFPYFVFMMFLSGVVGLLAAVVVRETGITFLGLDISYAGFGFYYWLCWWRFLGKSL